MITGFVQLVQCVVCGPKGVGQPAHMRYPHPHRGGRKQPHCVRCAWKRSDVIRFYTLEDIEGMERKIRTEQARQERHAHAEQARKERAKVKPRFAGRGFRIIVSGNLFDQLRELLYAPRPRDQRVQFDPPRLPSPRLDRETADILDIISEDSSRGASVLSERYAVEFDGLGEDVRVDRDFRFSDVPTGFVPVEAISGEEILDRLEAGPSSQRAKTLNRTGRMSGELDRPYPVKLNVRRRACPEPSRRAA